MLDAAQLASAYLATASTDANGGEVVLGTSADPVEILGPALVRMIDRAQAAWPSILLDPVAFVRHVAGHMRDRDGSASALDRLPAGDLFLAFACASGDAVALAEFDAKYLRGIASNVARIDSSPSFIDEVRQRVRERLLVRTERSPRIADYAGSGTLLGWLQVAATRVALNLKQREGRLESPLDEDTTQLIVNVLDSELRLIHERFHAMFRVAFRESVQSLSSRDRLVISLHYCDALSLEAIGRMHQVNRSTVSRWLATARAQVLDSTRAKLRECLQIDSVELDSVLRAAASQIEVSFNALHSRADT